MQVKLLLFTFYLNGRLHTVSVGENCLNGRLIFGRFSFLKTESEPNFLGFCKSLIFRCQPNNVGMGKGRGNLLEVVKFWCTG